MAGGVFSAQNKVRPGAYINTVSQIQDNNDNTTGVVLLVNSSNLNWGKNGVITLDKSSNLNALLGTNLADPKLLPLREAFKNANVVKLVNSNGGSKSSLDIQNTPLKATAIYPGTKGNDIVVNVIRNLADNSKVNIKTLFNNRIIDNQLVGDPKQVTDNTLVHFDINGSDFTGLTATAGGNLSGGSTDSGNLADVVGEALQNENFDVATTGGFSEDNNINTLVASMVQDLRDHEGYKVTAVIPKGSNTVDNEAVTQVANGVVLNDNTTIDKTVASAYVAGLSATAPLNQSLTYRVYSGAIEAYPTFNNDNTINNLNNGNMVFTQLRSGDVVVESDINSLHSFGEKPKEFSKNKIIRVLDYFENDTKEVFEKSFIGKVSNNGDGRSLFLANRMAKLKELQTAGAIEDVQDGDVVVDKGNASDSIVVNIRIKPVDSIEKLYLTVYVQ